MLAYIFTNLLYAVVSAILGLLFLALIAYILTGIDEKRWLPSKSELDTLWGVLIGVNVIVALITIFVSVPMWGWKEHDRRLIATCQQVEANGEDVTLASGDVIQIGMAPRNYGQSVIIYNNGIPVGEFTDTSGDTWYVDHNDTGPKSVYYLCKR